MSAIYIHIPVCKSKCYYCDFYSEVSQSVSDGLIQGIKKEIDLRSNQQEEWYTTASTIYFGGGTPSLLSVGQVEYLLEHLRSKFEFTSDIEITMEVNPDDLTLDYLTGIYAVGVNRLSMGIQSTFDSLLKKMNRRHNALQALECMNLARKAGFRNISIDLIYGIPDLSMVDWKNSLQTILQYLPNHVSAYHLTFEPGTPFYTMKNKGELEEINDVDSMKQYELLMQQTDIAGYEHYEISNFALPGYRSKHNQKYWSGEKYMGIGPAAHSYNGIKRFWNVSDNKQYIAAFSAAEKWYESEQLSDKDRFNEYVMTRLRTLTGVDLGYIKSNFGNNYYEHLIAQSKRSELLKIEDDKLKIDNRNWFISDALISDLFIV